ncbi:MAG: endolytic transglycosylase MltG, partial [Mycobacteriales bacterium]
MSDLSILGVDDDQPAPPTGHRRRPPMRRRVAPVIALAVVIVLAVGAFIGGRAIVREFRAVPDYQGSGTGTVLVEVESGATAGDIAAALVKADVVASERAFLTTAKKDPRSVNIQPATYRMHRSMSAAAALTLMLDPTSRVGQVTIPEGLTVDQTLALLATHTKVPLAAYRAAAAQPGKLGLPTYAHGRLEGMLFPSTYYVAQQSSATT